MDCDHWMETCDRKCTVTENIDIDPKFLLFMTPIETENKFIT